MPDVYLNNSWPVWGNSSTTANWNITTGTNTYGTWTPNYVIYDHPKAELVEDPKPKRRRQRSNRISDPLEWLSGRVDEVVALGRLDN
jgi:hypothetical protein